LKYTSKKNRFNLIHDIISAAPKPPKCVGFGFKPQPRSAWDSDLNRSPEVRGIRI